MISHGNLDGLMSHEMLMDSDESWIRSLTQPITTRQRNWMQKPTCSHRKAWKMVPREINTTWHQESRIPKVKQKPRLRGLV